MQLPDLYAHFEDEELELREWAHSWYAWHGLAP
jgi:hypothetical protein